MTVTPLKRKEIDTDRIPAEVFDKIKEKAANKPAPINNTELVRDFREKGGQIVHILPNNRYPSRGMTAAFVLKNGRVEIATAVQHRSDDFTKKIGTKLAIESFNNGKTVYLPCYNKGRKAISDLIHALTVMC